MQKYQRELLIFEQVAVLRSTDRDGVEEVTKFTVNVDPGVIYEPAADYAIDASAAYLTPDERGRDVVHLRKNVRLVQTGAARKLKAAA